MKLSARLILLLTFSVSVVMVAPSLITLRQREAALREAARDEPRVHALTLKIALEEDYLTGRSLDAQRLINRLKENTGIYSMVLFDAAGEIVAISNTLAPEEFRYLNEAREVMASGKGIEIARSISGEDYFSMILPLLIKDRRIGAIEIVQSISFVKADIARARFHILITALLLFITILLVVTAVTRYNLARPIHELLDGAMAVGRGDLNYRVRVRSSGSELASLAREFNRMADRLAENSCDRLSDGRLVGDCALRGRLLDRQECRRQTGEESRRTRLLFNRRLIVLAASEERMTKEVREITEKTEKTEQTEIFYCFPFVPSFP